MIRGLVLFALTVSAPASAQSPDPGYSDLDAEIIARIDPFSLFVTQAAAAYDEAVGAADFERADSVATLVEVRVRERRQDTAFPVAWPSRLDALALATLRGEPSVLDSLVAEARRVRDTATDSEPGVLAAYGESGVLRWTLRPALRSSLATALAARLDDLQIGQTTDAVEAIQLVARSWIEGEPWIQPGARLSRERQALNEDATLFLDRYPESRYAGVVRYLVRHIYERDVSSVIAIGIGATASSGALAERTEAAPLALDLIWDLRGRWWHGGLTLQAAYLDIPSVIEVGEDRAEVGERYQIGLFGIESGPLVRTGWIEAMPYVAVGYVDRLSTNGEDGNARQGSTFDPGGRLGLGYGLKLAVRSPRVFASLPGVHGRVGWIGGGLGDRDGVDLTGASRLLTAGLSWSLNGGRRAY